MPDGKQDALFLAVEPHCVRLPFQDIMGAAVGALACTAGIMVAAQGTDSKGYAFLYFLAVVWAARTRGSCAGVATAALSMLAYEVFFRVSGAASGQRIAYSIVLCASLVIVAAYVGAERPTDLLHGGLARMRNGGRRVFWKSSNTEDYSGDCERGAKLARVLIRAMHGGGEHRLGWTIRDMAELHEFGAVETGFCRELARFAVRGSLETVADNDTQSLGMAQLVVQAKARI